ncbi:MAG TPA: MarR family winged helix-turn-helix transcriptional regulator [Candidatus Nanoarchaeia archaeon]|nr:MarR family winged helix-turn-helix transcriptional regulator [Candidatus Nanoarchaeia archaeon]
MKVLSIACLALLLISTVSAQIDSIQISTSIEGTTAYIDYFVIVNGPAEKVTIPIPKDSSVTYAKDSYGVLIAEKNNNSLELVFQKPINAFEKRNMIAKVKSQNLIANKGYYEYVWDIELPNTAKFDHVVILPEDAKEIKPKPQTVLEEKLERPAVVWSYPSFKSGIFLIDYERPQPISWLVILPIAFIAAVIGISFVILRNKPKKPVSKAEKTKSEMPQQDKSKILEKIGLMNVKEKQVLEIIVDKGEANQYELKAKLGLTKSNLSKIIKNLEMKGLVKRERHGKINKIYPGEKLK